MRVSNAGRICPPHMHVRTDERTYVTMHSHFVVNRSPSDAREKDRSEEVVGWPISELTCQHGNTSGACPECRNGVDPTTGDVA